MSCLAFILLDVVIVVVGIDDIIFPMMRDKFVRTLFMLSSTDLVSRLLNTVEFNATPMDVDVNGTSLSYTANNANVNILFIS